MDSKVLRPMRITWSRVFCLNHWSSSGIFQGSWLFLPMTWLRDIAAMALKGGRRVLLEDECGIGLYSDGRFDGGMRVIIDELEVLEFKVAYIFDVRVEE